MKNQENKVFLDFFERHYARCFSYVKLSVNDDEAVKSIITEAMKCLWNEHLTKGTSVDDLGRLVRLLDKGIANYSASQSVKGVRGYKNARDAASFSAAQIDCLPPKRKEIFLLSRVQGLTSAQIAQEMSISPRTVDKHIELALKQLKQNNESE